MRGREFFPQLHELPGPNPSQVRSGILLLLIGLIKKVVLADFLLSRHGSMPCSAPVTDLSMAAAWLAPLLFGFQIYYDFSGYVDMALGMSKLFGLELKAELRDTVPLAHAVGVLDAAGTSRYRAGLRITSMCRSADRAVRSGRLCAMSW